MRGSVSHPPFKLELVQAFHLQLALPHHYRLPFPSFAIHHPFSHLYFLCLTLSCTRHGRRLFGVIGAVLVALDVARRSVPGPYLAGASRARRALRGQSPSGRVGTARPKSPLPQLSARLFNSAPRVLDRLCGQLCWYTLAPPAGLGRRSSAYHHHHDPCHCKRSGHAAGVPVRPSSQLSRARRVNIRAARLAAVWRSHRLSAPAPEPARRLSSPVSFGTNWDHSLVMSSASAACPFDLLRSMSVRSCLIVISVC